MSPAAAVDKADAAKRHGKQDVYKRQCLTKGFLEYVKQEDPDVICLQETKLQPEQAVFELEGYHRYFYSAEKKGYSGTAVLTRQEPISMVDVYKRQGSCPGPTPPWPAAAVTSAGQIPLFFHGPPPGF